MKSVSPKKYNRFYFQHFGFIDYKKGLQKAKFKKTHLHIISLLRHTVRDSIVDFGCGMGDLDFLLAKKYPSGINIVGIDYSKDAIQIAQKNMKIIARTDFRKIKNITFACHSNDNLPTLTNITHVYLADVLEHMYEEEIHHVLSEIIKWNKNKITLLIHTDNKYYLLFIKPIVFFIFFVAGKISLQRIRSGDKWTEERHVNLKTPRSLVDVLQHFGFTIKKFEYSPISSVAIRTHFTMVKLPEFIIRIIINLAFFFRFLMPGMYLVAERNNARG